MLRHRRERLVDRRESRVDLPGKRNIVEAGNRQFIGNLDAQPVGHANDAGGHVVVRCEYGRWAILRFQQLRRALFTGSDRTVACRYEPLRESQAALFETIAVAKVAIADRLMARVTRNECDPFVPQ